MKMTQLPMFLPESQWKAPEMSELPSDWNRAQKVAIDLETYDPNLKSTGPSVRTGGHIAGIAFAPEGGKGFYLPIRHEGGGNLPVDNVMAYIGDQLRSFEGYIVGANLSYDLDWLWHERLFSPNCRGYKDVLVAEPLIDENQFSYSLDNVGYKWTGERKEKSLMLEAARAYGMKTDKELGAWIHRLPACYVGPYGEQDVLLPLKTLALQEQEIRAQNIEGVWKLESELLPVLVKMRQRGVRVDEDALMQIEIRSMRERTDAANRITELTGVRVGPEDAMQKKLLLKALNEMGHRLKDADPIDNAFFRANGDCPAVQALAEMRKWDTLRKLCIDPVQQHLVDGRMHCIFNQLAAERDDGRGAKGARFGRLSCEHVNLQQQPARDEEIGPMWRGIYLPNEGMSWASCDYSQQEPKVLVHWAELCSTLNIPGFPMNGAVEAANAYRDDPNTDNHQMMADMAGISRKEAKLLFLGLCYGMGEIKLCHDLGLPTKIIEIEKGPRQGERRVVAGDEAAGILHRLHSKIPFLRQMETLCKQQAAKRGFITTLSGRRCRFPLNDDGINFNFTRKALNRLIQGSAADQTKRAMVEADREGFELQLQVHDEICLSVERPETAHGLADCMREAIELRVPSKVDVEIGKSWGDSM